MTWEEETEFVQTRGGLPAWARRVGFALCLAAGFLLSCRVAVVPPPPGPAGLPGVATGGRTYAEVLREAERIAAIKDPAKREEVEIDWSLFWLGLL